MRRMTSIHVGIVVVLAAFAITGCMLFDDQQQATPVSPVGDATQLQNFWVGRGQDKYSVTTGGEQLEVSVPQGSYILEYTTSYGSFYIVFKAISSVTLFVGLQPGDVVQNVFLYLGEISDDVVPIQENGIYKVYELPGEETASDWYDYFTGEMDVIILMVDGVVIIEDDTDGEYDDGEDGEDDGEDVGDDDAADGKWDVTATAVGAGSITPVSKIVPNGASISLKIKPDSRNFEDILSVTVNGENVMPYVQELGNGDGHLVIHGVDADLEVVAKFGSSPKATVKPPKTPKTKTK